MKRKQLIPLTLLITLTLVLIANALDAPSALAQGPKPGGTRAPRADLGTAFTYQGQLKQSGSPVTGNCDFVFALWDAASAGTQLGTTQSKTNTSVTNGYFTISELDFGTGAFDGNARWLGIGVRCPTGSGSYTPLGRQSLTATPYALYAKSAPWGGLTGVPTGFADGADNDTTYTAGTGLTLTGNQFSVDTSVIQQRVSGTCGSGNAIRVINADGTVTCEAIPSAFSGWALTGNSGTVNGTNFLGTTDNVSLTLRVSNTVGWRLAPSGANTPNVIGGYSGNLVSSGASGATIGGGGSSGAVNSVTGSGGTVSGGDRNSATIQNATVGGGSWNTASGYAATVGGGVSNNAVGDWAPTICGGKENSTNGYYNTIAGGYSNHTSASNTSIGGGQGNEANASGATVPGGYSALASHVAEMAYSSGRFVNTGDAQTSVYVLRNTTTNSATPTELYLNGADARLTIANNRTLTFDILVVARSQGNAAAGYHIRGVIENTGGNLEFVGGTPTATELGEEIAAWGVSVEADDASGALLIKVTGDAASTIRWVATVRTVEVNY